MNLGHNHVWLRPPYGYFRLVSGHSKLFPPSTAMDRKPPVVYALTRPAAVCHKLGNNSVLREFIEPWSSA